VNSIEAVRQELSRIINSQITFDSPEEEYLATIRLLYRNCYNSYLLHVQLEKPPAYRAAYLHRLAMLRQTIADVRRGIYFLIHKDWDSVHPLPDENSNPLNFWKEYCQRFGIDVCCDCGDTYRHAGGIAYALRGIYFVTDNDTPCN
jgi:hypothetical protein